MISGRCTLNDSTNNNENVVITPRKKKSLNQADSCNVTPPKQRKEDIEKLLRSPSTPSSLLKKLNIGIPESKNSEKEKLEPKQLFEDKNVYRCARKALHSTIPASLPCREDQLLELKMYVMEHIAEEKSGTIYISGPPGTGKTASLSTILYDPQVITLFFLTDVSLNFM